MKTATVTLTVRVDYHDDILSEETVKREVFRHVWRDLEEVYWQDGAVRFRTIQEVQS